MACSGLAEDQLAASVHTYLGLLLFENAKFLCERLVASCPSEANTHLLALCYFHCNQVHRSYHLLKASSASAFSEGSATASPSPASRYLLALCCLQLGKLSEAKEALSPRRGASSPDDVDGHVPNGAAGHYLLGRVSRLGGRNTEAREHFVRALRLDPLLWLAYEELCAIGGDEQAAEICASSVAAAAEAAAAAAATAAEAAAATMAASAGAQQPSDSDEAMEDAHGGCDVEEEEEDGRVGGGTASSAGGWCSSADGTPASATAGPASGQGLIGRGRRPHAPALPGHAAAASRSWDIISPVNDRSVAPTPAGGVGGRSYNDLHQQLPPPSSSTGPSSHLQWAPRQQQQQQQQQLNVGEGGDKGGVPSMPAPPRPPHSAGPPFGPTHHHGSSSVSASASATTWLTPAGGGGSGFVTPAAAAAPVGAPAGAGAVGGMQQQMQSSPPGTGLSFETPAALAGPNGPPAPPQKAAAAAAAGHPEGGGNPFLGFTSMARSATAAVSGSETGGRTPSPALMDPPASALMTAAMTASPSPQNRQQQQQQRNGGRLAEPADGKVRKVSGKLFQDPGSVRRSSRLAALAGGSSPPVAYGAPASHHHCQNQPDPDHPPGSPVHRQAHMDAKIGVAIRRGDRLAGIPFGGHQLATRPGRAGSGLFLQGGDGDNGSDNGSAAVRARLLLVPPHLRHLSTPEGLALAIGLLAPLMEAYRHMCMYRCKEALQAFSRLPPKQYTTAWVYCQVGRTHFEAVEYRSAAAAFEAARALDGQRVEGMELYSTVLWHLRRESELAHLVQEMQAADRLSPQAWCVLGNFCSLQKDHESAVELFQRAVQLDPTFTYAFTLAGHEYFANEDYDKSMACYRNAVRLDPRHYNAMYGLGQIYFRQEKYDMAAVHFKSAASINPSSSVLHCYIAMTLHRQGLHDRALTKLQEAIALDPKNPLARFERAAVLMSLDMPEQALEELQRLSQLSPAEPSVHFQMGRAYKKLGDLERAQQQLEVALSFSSSSADAGSIKTAIEKLTLNEEQEEDEL